jgi:hypothetical protein
MRINLLASILLLGFSTSVQALPVCTIPSPTDLNLTPPQPKVVKPLISRSYLAMVEGEACQAVSNGTEPAFIKADIYRKITLQPARTYRYSEVRQLTSDIYTRVGKCRVYIANKSK